MMTKEQRLAMIKNAANKIQGNLELRAQQAKVNARFIADCNKKIAKIKAKQEAKLAKELDALDENYNEVDAKTARKIANSCVGDIYRETTKFDNEWN